MYFVIIFLRVCSKKHFNENPFILKSVDCFTMYIDFSVFMRQRGLYQTGFPNNYRFTTENLDAQNNTTDK